MPLVPLITIGLLLTVSGIYAVLAFAVARRSKEFALRTALGASGLDVVQLVAAHSLRLITIGSVLGVAATFALTRVVRANGGAGSFFDTPGWPCVRRPDAGDDRCGCDRDLDSVPPRAARRTCRIAARRLKRDCRDALKGVPYGDVGEDQWPVEQM